MADAAGDSSQTVKIKIRLPKVFGCEIDFVETTHSLHESMSDVKEALAATSQLSNVTNYDLEFEGVRITNEYDDLDDLKSVFGDAREIVDLELKERPYGLREVYEQLVRFRESIGLNFFDQINHNFSVAFGSEKFTSLGLNDIKPESIESKDSDNLESKTLSDDKSMLTSTQDLEVLKRLSLTIFDEKPVPLTDHASSNSIRNYWTPPLKSLSVSQWNPVPPQQKIKGDLLYLTLTTLESETFSITCHASGFYVNNMSNAYFNPSIKLNEKGVFHKSYILQDLIVKLSPKFSSVLAKYKEQLGSASQFSESFMLPSQISKNFSWIVKEETPIPDHSTTQFPLYANGVDGADALKDWNDEFQGIKEFPRTSFNERLLRDKLINKYIEEFNQTAVSTAIEVAKGSFSPLNPNEPREKHIFLRNNIFYSFGVDATGSYLETGGDEAARYCFSRDVSTVKLLNRVDSQMVCNLLTCVVDYLGTRVICQAPVPGIFNDQKDSGGQIADKVAYGYSLDQNRINLDENFESALKPIAEAFHLKAHEIKLSSGASTEGKNLVVSKDFKGIYGSDGRKYVIDLHRSTPLDIEFLDAHFDDMSDLSYPHKEASLRNEAVEEWYKRKAAAIFKLETERLETEANSAQSTESKDKPQVAIPFDQICFNPDTFAGETDLDEDKEIVREMSSFVQKNLIPEFLDEISNNAVPYDGSHLSDYLHRSGINIRYLGEIASQALKKLEQFEKDLEIKIKANESEIELSKNTDSQSDQSDEIEASRDDTSSENKQESSAATMIPLAANMRALHNLCIQDMIARAAKHVLRKLCQSVDFILKPFIISHFHNCLLGKNITENPQVLLDEDILSFVAKKDLSFMNLTTPSVSNLIEHEVLIRFRFNLPKDWLDNIKPLQMQREIAYKFGIQWKAREYAFTTEEIETDHTESSPNELSALKIKGKRGKSQVSHAIKPSIVKRTTTYVPDDICSFVPLIKDSSFKCMFVDEVFETARLQISKGEKQIGLDLLSELIAFYQQIYGVVHQETAHFYSALAQVYSECEMHSKAAIMSRRATILHERLTGIDSYETINSYVKSSYFESMVKDHINGFKMNMKAYQDWSLVYGIEHPNTVNTFSSFATVFHQLNLISEARKFFEMALGSSISLNGELSDITATIRHRFGVFLVQNKDYKTALDNFEKASFTFDRIVGPTDVISKECSTFAKNLAKYLSISEKNAEENKAALKNNLKKSKKNSKASQIQTRESKNRKEKKNEIHSVPEIASKSVDEILQFIEGSSSQKRNKKKK